jgi:predicted transcriptional regulator
MDGQELREKHQAKGLGERGLATILGISQRDISRIEGGRKKASEGVAKKLTEAMK